MTVKEVTDALYIAGESRDKVKIRVKGRVNSSEYIEKPTSGEFEIPVDVDVTTDDIEVDNRNECVEITAWIS